MTSFEEARTDLSAESIPLNATTIYKSIARSRGDFLDLDRSLYAKQVSYPDVQQLAMSLTAKETSLVGLLQQGRTESEIAQQLHRDGSWVKWRIDSAAAKFGLSYTGRLQTDEAVRDLAIENDLIGFWSRQEQLTRIRKIARQAAKLTGNLPNISKL